MLHSHGIAATVASKDSPSLGVIFRSAVKAEGQRRTRARQLNAAFCASKGLERPVGSRKRPDFRPPAVRRSPSSAVSPLSALAQPPDAPPGGRRDETP